MSNPRPTPTPTPTPTPFGNLELLCFQEETDDDDDANDGIISNQSSSSYYDQIMSSNLGGMSDYQQELRMILVGQEKQVQEKVVVNNTHPLLGQLIPTTTTNDTQETDVIKWIEQTEQHEASINNHVDGVVVLTNKRMTTEVGEGSSVKKEDHNAKERVRRMKLNATFQALRSMLPDSRRPKKRWSGPYVIDRALEYIPQLQSHVHKLTLEKHNIIQQNRHLSSLLATTTDDVDHQPVLNNQVHNSSSTLTVSINEVKQGELIIQLCQHDDKPAVLTTLFDQFEGQGMRIIGASSLSASENRTCFHVHIQMCEKPRESDYVSILHQKIIAWLL